MYKRVLIAFDGSEYAGHVLEQALVLARSENASVDIASVIPGYDGDLRLLGNTGALDSMREQYRTALQEAREKALAFGVRAATRLLSGEPQAEIISLAEELGTDLIVIGKRKRFFLDALPVGLTAEEIISGSPVDVLVIAGDRRLNMEILFLAHDGGKEDANAAARAATLAARYGSRLVIGVAYELGMEAFALASQLEEQLLQKAGASASFLEARAREAGITRLETRVLRGDPACKTLGDEAKVVGAGLVVAGANEAGGLASVVPGKGITRLVGCSPCPVLAVKGKA